MHTIHVHSEVDLCDIVPHLPNDVRLLQLCPAEGRTKPPHLVMFQANGDHAHLVSIVRHVAAHLNPGALTLLPHPRNPNPLESQHIKALAKHLPIKKGHTMKDVLTRAFAMCPSHLVDPELHCY